MQVGLDLDDADSDGVSNAIINRSDIKPIVIQAITAISFILGEIKELQQKYQLRKIPSPERPSSDVKFSPSAKGLRTLSIIRSTSLRQRMRANQREKSIISIAKWAMRDARKFEGKVNRMKSLIDSLENIGLLSSSISQSTDSPATLEEEIPPPYSFAAARITCIERPQIVDIPRPTRSTRLSDNSIADLLEHHAVMKQYLAGLPVGDDHPVPRAKEKLIQLSEQQFKELRNDAFDELCRRQQFETPPPQWLPDVDSYHPKRNEARRKLSTLISTRFEQLMLDIVCELERRFPQLQDCISPLPSLATPVDTRRWGYIDRRPPPLLQDRPVYQSTRQTSAETPLPSSLASSPAISPSSYRSSGLGSFRVSMNDPTSKVIPTALKKYNIHSPWEHYSLVLVFGELERHLKMDERPLVLYKQLEREGKQPVFILRKTSAAWSGNNDVEERALQF